MKIVQRFSCLIVTSPCYSFPLITVNNSQLHLSKTESFKISSKIFCFQTHPHQWERSPTLFSVLRAKQFCSATSIKVANFFLKQQNIWLNWWMKFQKNWMMSVILEKETYFWLHQIFRKSSTKRIKVNAFPELYFTFKSRWKQTNFYFLHIAELSTLSYEPTFN